MGRRGRATVLDPHGDLVPRIHALLPEARRETALYLDLSALDISLNLFANVLSERRPLTAANLGEIFRKTWADSWGPRLEHVLRNAFLALLDHPGGTLADVPRLFPDKGFRHSVARGVAHEQERSFWLDEYERYPLPMRLQVAAPVANKVGAFLSDPRILRLVAGKGRATGPEIMENGGMLLVNLSKGELGEGPASLVGSLLVASIGLAGLARSALLAEMRRDFYVYLDEVHLFATLSLAGVLSELRKYRVNLILAHQYLSQVSPYIRDAVLGNVGTWSPSAPGRRTCRSSARNSRPSFRPRICSVSRTIISTSK
jgi:hypothetical protein